MNGDPLELLLRMYRAGVAAANPAHCLQTHWPEPVRGRTGLIACGKAALQMTVEACRHYGDGIDGVVIHPDSETRPDGVCDGLEWHASSHPVPCERSVRAAQAALDFAAGLGPDDLLLVLLSGGGSSLMCLPAEGVSLEEKQDLGRQLLASGASIGEINRVRKHLSRIKGGRLAAACRAPVVTLAISDVPGDDPSMIASGPTVEDRSSLAEARYVIERYGIRPAESIRRALDDPENESPRFDPDGPSRENRIVASGNTALQAAADICEREGIRAITLGDHLQGEARELGKTHARMVAGLAGRGQARCLLSGGETTVTVSRNPGAGGRNTEYALALAIELDGRPGIWAISADTDGVDGHGGHAGATADPGTLQRGRDAGLDPAAALAHNDSAAFFKKTGGLLVEGPTGTNVNDFRAILIES